MSSSGRLEQLLSESRDAAMVRESQAFDRATHPAGTRIVIYGAGALGRRLLSGLRANGADALAFADCNPALWSASVHGVPVLSPETAVWRYGSTSAFLISGLPANAQLTAMGCTRVVPFPLLFWKYPLTFLPTSLWDLPSRILDSADEVRRTFQLFAGHRSQAEFVRQLELRLTGDFGCLTQPVEEPRYFPRHLFRPRQDECFVDCGAYHGDSLRHLADWTGGHFQKALAFEPDPANFAALQDSVAGDPRLREKVRTVSKAVGSEHRGVQFATSGRGGPAISESGDIDVECVPLDEVLTSEGATYIKMDIEGAEVDALSGSASVLRRDRPTLAICAHHAQSHLWRVPRKIHQFLPESRLVLRPHGTGGFDLVCYAIPPGREADLSSEDRDH